jgi:hypothetical protein
MLRRVDPATLLRSGVEIRLRGRERASDQAEPIGEMPKIENLLWVEEDAALAGVIVLEHVEDAIGDTRDPFGDRRVDLDLTGERRVLRD